VASPTRREVPPLEGDQLSQAVRAHEALASVLGSRKKASVQLVADGSTAVAVPREVFAFFVAVLEQLAAGEAVTFIPVNKEMTTQEAADFLNVSRPYVIRLLEEQKIPCRKVGKHRRVLFADLVRYREADDRKRAAVLSELVREAEELGLEY
jgi:excisionase family DNA binding protein